MNIGRTFFSEVCLFVVLFFTTSASHVDAKLSEAIQKQKKAVVTLHVDDAGGKHLLSASGALLDERGVVVTSCQVISMWMDELGNTIVVRTEGGTSFPMEKLLSSDCNNNVALVRIRRSELPTAKLAVDYRPRTRESVMVADRASGRDVVISEGKVGNIYKNSEFFQVTVPAKAQREGSLVFNTKGEVIGISTTLGKKQKRTVVVPAKYISKEFSKYRGRIKETSILSALPPVAPRAPAPETSRVPAGIGDRAEQEFLRGVSYDKAHMYREAVEAYREAVRLKPDYPDAYVNLGIAYYRLENYEEAANAYRHALSISPSQAIYNKLGATCILLGQYRDAIEYFKQSVKADPANSETHFNLGVAYVLAGDRDGAVNEYITLKGLDRKSAEKLLELIY